MSLRGLVKRFDTRLAVSGVSLDVPVGSFFGLLGPNGAGKTTTLSMAVGLLRPDAGRVTLLGYDVWHSPAEAKALVGVLPDGVRMFDRLSGPELLAYHGLLRGMPAEIVDQRARDLLDVLELGSGNRTLVVDYSAGMKKKIGLACALLHAPRLLVLDEPFEAVDPVSAALIRDILAWQWPWLGLPAGVVYGGGAYLLGAWLAGRMLDRRMPELLAAVTPR